MATMAHALTIVYASTSGHTEFVVDTVITRVTNKNNDLKVSKKRAEEASVADVTGADVVVLASSTWNTGNVEGQLNPHMHELIKTRLNDIDLKHKPMTVIGLGDERYFYTARAFDALMEFVQLHNGNLFMPGLKIVNEPYDQVEKIERWAAELAAQIEKLPAKVEES